MAGAEKASSPLAIRHFANSYKLLNAECAALIVCSMSRVE
jgi:hypothetical protein